ncbi:MAG: transcription termination/antitermination NusG family protein [Planctomycetota bacterium]
MAPEWHIRPGRARSASGRTCCRRSSRPLEDRSPEILLPVETVSDIKAGKKRVSKRKLFPGYLMLHADLDESVWFAPGRDPRLLGDFVGGAASLSRWPRTRSTASSVQESMCSAQRRLQEGRPGQDQSGHFENLDGSVEEVDVEKGRVKVIVTIFGRATPVDLEHWELEPI